MSVKAFSFMLFFIHYLFFPKKKQQVMNDGPKTILVLTPGFAKDESDTTCLPFQQVFLRTFHQQFPLQKVIILSFQYPYEECTYQWHGMNVISMGGKNKGGFFRQLLWEKIRRRLKRIYTENDITAVLSFWCGECSLVAQQFANKYKLPWFCWIAGQDAKKDNSYVKRIQPSPGSLVAVSDFIADEFERNHGIRPAHIIPPGIEDPQPSKLLPEKDIDIVGAGSLIPLKQYDAFVEIIYEVKNKFPGIKAVIAGDGHEKENLQRMIIERGLVENITLTGEIPHPEVLALMERSRLFLHTSCYEGFGIVCIEALNAGCQVISFTRPMKAIITNWHIVPGKQAMVEKTISLLQANNIPERVIFNEARNTATQFASMFNL
jgi:glycosyltransferase involved in cell wall biosynthesis